LNAPAAVKLRQQRVTSYFYTLYCNASQSECTRL
jgi:hypothetical protein